MNLSDYLLLPDIKYHQNLLISEKSSLGTSMSHAAFPINYDVALVGVNTDINALNNKGTADAPDAIREQLYALMGNFGNFYVSDLGNIVPTKTIKDTYSALSQVVEYLISNRVIPIIIGGSQELTHALFQGMSQVKQTINLACVDLTIDASEDADFHNHSYLSFIAKEKKLESVSMMAYQNYVSNEKDLEAQANVPVEKIRLANVRKHMADMEVSFRDADLVSFDIGSVRLADAPGCAHGQANGLYAEEICQLARYAGFSDRISAFGLFETNPSLDRNGQTAGLSAQVIWHFLDGLNNRQKDYPLRDIASYNNYIIHQPDINQDIKFYNNPANNRWWMEIPGTSPKIVSCTMKDYHDAGQNKIPDRFMRWI